MARKSPFDVRSVDPAIVEIVLRELIAGDGHALMATIDGKVRAERFAGKIDSRMSRKTSSSTDELVELTWFGIIEVVDDQVFSRKEADELKSFLEDGLRSNLEESYYSKEILYRLMIDLLRSNGGRMSEQRLLDLIGNFIIDTRQYPGYGFTGTQSVPTRFNKAKLFYLIRAGRKLGTIEKTDSEVSLVRKEDDIRIIIMQSYLAVSRSLTSIEFQPLWVEVQSRAPSVARESFDKSLLELREIFFPGIDLFQASGKLTIKDPLTGKYYHHVRMDTNSIQDMINSLRDGGIT